ncbi:DUF4041 domain-containing protein [Synechococcus sp. L2F]|uniref:DUF4041 domain-containing protein n=1 Tax=Synechococcus sp. L2F TaxID=2823739 RepID=UPI0020CF103C|nr:DUF4041 domain-containing protein [Synechococcus sp. L2F]MCP9829280.1 DUF4041 domain-containing protein [Synechococcus sp. L2F]
MELLFLVLLVAALLVWGSSLQRQVSKLKDRLRPISSIELYAKTARRIADSDLEKARDEATQILSAAKQESSELEQRIASLRADAKSAKQELVRVNEGLRLIADDAHLLEVGYYRPVYGFEDLPKYQEAIEKIKEAQKSMLRVAGEARDKAAAAYATRPINYNGSEAQGRKLLKKVLQLMLRAFNGECDAFIARVNYRNIITMQKRIQSSFDQINKIADAWDCQISRKYLANRLEELGLVYEYAKFQEKVKEEQAWIREQEREEEKARKEAEKRERDAAKKADSVEQAVREARQAMEAAAESDKAAFRKQIEALERELANALEDKKRAKSLAEQTRTGYVYIFSNIGSFGEHVFKIGMTRREDPEVRRRELGDASVPFPFDCHAYIWTEDAPTLERELHKHFEPRRLNLENERKEFFRITIDEIQAEVEKLKSQLGIAAEIRWTMLAEAKDFRLSEAKRKYLQFGNDRS